MVDFIDDLEAPQITFQDDLQVEVIPEPTPQIPTPAPTPTPRTLSPDPTISEAFGTIDVDPGTRALGDVAAKFGGGAAAFAAGVPIAIAHNIYNLPSRRQEPEAKPLSDTLKGNFPPEIEAKLAKMSDPKIREYLKFEPGPVIDPMTTPSGKRKSSERLMAAVSAIFVDTPHPDDPTKTIPGMIYGKDGLIKPFTQVGTASEEISDATMEKIEKVLDVVLTPAHKVDTLITEAGNPNVGFISGLVSELLTFKLLHKAGAKAKDIVKLKKDLKEHPEFGEEAVAKEKANLEGEGLLEEIKKPEVEIPVEREIEGIPKLSEAEIRKAGEELPKQEPLVFEEDLGKPVEPTPEPTPTPPLEVKPEVPIKPQVPIEPKVEPKVEKPVIETKIPITKEGEINWDKIPEWVEPDVEGLKGKKWSEPILKGEFTNRQFKQFEKWLDNEKIERLKQAEEIKKIEAKQLGPKPIKPEKIEEAPITKVELPKLVEEVKPVKGKITLDEKGKVEITSLKERYPLLYESFDLHERKHVKSIEQVDTRGYLKTKLIPKNKKGFDTLIKRHEELAIFNKEVGNTRKRNVENAYEGLNKARESKEVTRKEFKIIKNILDDLKTDPDFKLELKKGNKNIIKGLHDSLRNKIKASPTAVIHEVGHWAFENILSSKERIEFFKSMEKFYDKEGNFDKKAYFKATPLSPKMRGSNIRINITDSFGEYFAEQFQTYVSSNYLNRVEYKHLFRTIVDSFKVLYRRYRNKKVLDPSLEKYMKNIIDFDAKRVRAEARMKKSMKEKGIEPLKSEDILNLLREKSEEVRREKEAELTKWEEKVAETQPKEDFFDLEREELEGEGFGKYDEEGGAFEGYYPEEEALEFVKVSSPKEKDILKEEVIKEANSREAMVRAEKRLLAKRAKAQTIADNKALNAAAKKLDITKSFEADLRTIFTRSFEEGLPVKDLLERAGYSKESALATQYLTKVLERKDKLAKGEPANRPGFRRREAGGILWDIERPWVYKPEVRTLKRTIDITPSLSDSLMTPDTFFRKIDKEGREMRALFQDPLRDAQANITEMKEAHNIQTKLIKRLVKPRRSRNFSAHLINMQRNGAQMLEAMNVKLKPLNANEIKAMRMLYSELDKFWYQLNEVRTASGKNPMKKVDNYFTFFRDTTMLEEMGMSPLSDFYDPREFERVKDVSFRYDKKRGVLKDKDGNVVPISLDWLKVYETYSNSAIRNINNVPPIAKIQELLKPFKEEGAKKGEQKVWSFKDDNPNAYNYIVKWTNAIASNRTTTTGSKWVDNKVRSINNNLTAALLSFSVRLVAIQPTAVFHTYAKLDEVSFARGLAKMVKPSEYQRAIKKSKVLKSRSLNSSVNDFLNAIVNEKGVMGKVRMSRDKLARFGLGFAKITDKVTAVSAWLMAEDYALRRGKRASEAERFADQIVIETQGSGSMLDRAPIQRSEMGKLITLFQSYNIGQFNTIWHNSIKDFRKSKDKNKRATQLVRMVIGFGIVNTLYENVLGMNSPAPTPVKAFQEEYEIQAKKKDKPSEASRTAWSLVAGGKELVALYPFLASISYGKGATPAFLSAINAALQAKDETALGKALLNIGGLPGAGQINRSYRGWKSDLPTFNIIAGGKSEDYRSKKKKTGKRGR